jgi:hypothetical protein
MTIRKKKVITMVTVLKPLQCPLDKILFLALISFSYLNGPIVETLLENLEQDVTKVRDKCVFLASLSH